MSVARTTSTTNYGDSRRVRLRERALVSRFQEEGERKEGGIQVRY
jgi:hypothetical protein